VVIPIHTVIIGNSPNNLTLFVVTSVYRYLQRD